MCDNLIVLKWKIFNEVILKSYVFNVNVYKYILNLKCYLFDCRILVVVGMLFIG